MSDFSFTIDNGFDFIIEEGGNTSINLRRGSWGDSGNIKLDLRKWIYKDGKEMAMKGCTLTDKGGDELAAVLCENGYGDTTRILKAIYARDDAPEAIEALNCMDEDDTVEDTEYYDPKELFNEECE